MTQNADRARRDFDTLVRLAPDLWTPTDHYLPFLLALVPDGAAHVIDVGCGGGRFTRLLADRATRVTGLDVSPESLALARRRSADHPNIDYVCADAGTWAWPRASFDCITCLTALHHLPLEHSIAHMKAALRPGGTLILHDILHLPWRTPRGIASLALALPPSIALKWIHHPRNVSRAALRRFWREHGRHETYLSQRDLKHLRATLLPGARVRTHLLFRYTLTWTRPPHGPPCREGKSSHAQAHPDDYRPSKPAVQPPFASPPPPQPPRSHRPQSRRLSLCCN